MTTFAYEFVQVNACAFQETITFSEELVEFITHNADERDFTISSGELTDVGEYVIELVSTIQVPTDYTLAVSNEVSASVSFTVVVEATCDVSHFVDWPLLTNTEYQHFV